MQCLSLRKKNVRIFCSLYYMFYTKYSFYYKNVCSLLQIQTSFIDNLVEIESNIYLSHYTYNLKLQLMRVCE